MAHLCPGILTFSFDYGVSLKEQQDIYSDTFPGFLTLFSIDQSKKPVRLNNKLSKKNISFGYLFNLQLNFAAANLNYRLWTIDNSQ
jgi:hypothetical protein